MVLKILKSTITDFNGIKIQTQVVFNYESKKRMKNEFWDWIRDKWTKYRNFDIFKNHNFGVIVQNTWTKGYYCF